MKKQMTMVIGMAVIAVTLASCTASPAVSSSTASTVPMTSSSAEVTAQSGVYRKITPEEAKALMDKGNVTVLDVRTLDEYNSGHVADAVRLEMADFTAKLSSVLPDKEADILVYCRSGNRSKTASDLLIEAGYTHVYDFGGIIDWPYDIVT